MERGNGHHAEKNDDVFAADLAKRSNSVAFPSSHRSEPTAFDVIIFLDPVLKLTPV